jgi:hypothetical protein
VAALYWHRLTDTGVTLHCFSEKGGKQNTKKITSLNFSWQFSFWGAGCVMCAACSCCCSPVKVWFNAREFRFRVMGMNKTTVKHKRCTTVASRGHENVCCTHWFLGRLNLSKHYYFKGSPPTTLCNSLSICIRIIVLSDYKPACNFHAVIFLDPFAKLRKAAFNVVIALGPSVRPHGATLLQLDGFLWNLIFESFSKICRENSGFIKMWQE